MRPLHYLRCPFCGSNPNRQTENGFLWSARPGEPIQGEIDVTLSVRQRNELVAVYWEIARNFTEIFRPKEVLNTGMHLCPDLQKVQKEVRPPSDWTG